MRQAGGTGLSLASSGALDDLSEPLEQSVARSATSGRPSSRVDVVGDAILWKEGHDAHLVAAMKLHRVIRLPTIESADSVWYAGEVAAVDLRWLPVPQIAERHVAVDNREDRGASTFALLSCRVTDEVKERSSPAD